MTWLKERTISGTICIGVETVTDCRLPKAAQERKPASAKRRFTSFQFTSDHQALM